MNERGRYAATGVEAQFEPGSRGRVLRNLRGVRLVRDMHEAEFDGLPRATVVDAARQARARRGGLRDSRRPRDRFGPLTLDDSSCLLLGDDRDFSHDRRFRGPVPCAAIFGRPLDLYAAKDWRRIGRRVE